MVEALGNKLKINSIDIIPSNIDHHNEYLKVADDESKYELLSVEEMGRQLNVSYEKNGCVNKGNNKVTDVSLSFQSSSSLMTSNCSCGFIVTTNATQLSDTYPLTDAYKGFSQSVWRVASADNTWLCLECPVPMAFTRIMRYVDNWYSDMENYCPNNFIVEVSNDGVDFDIILDCTELTLIPDHRYVYELNEEQVEYKYWRIRYPLGTASGQTFRFLLDGNVTPNPYIQTEFQKNKLVKLSPKFFNPVIPYREDYTDVLNHGTVSGSTNLTSADDNNIVWQAFRGNVSTNNEGWKSSTNQQYPCDLIYTFTDLQEEGVYRFSFRNGIGTDNTGCVNAMSILVVDENDNSQIVWYRRLSNISRTQYITDAIRIPFKFKTVKWQIGSVYNTHASIGFCQVWKEDLHGAYNLYKNSFIAKTVGNDSGSGGYLNSSTIEYFVDENNPLEVTFNDKHKEVFTSLLPLEVKPLKKYRLVTPRWIDTIDYNPSTYTDITDEQHELMRGSCSGIGTEALSFNKAFGVDNRTSNTSCWQSTDGNPLGGPIYKWNQVKPKGRYVFKFNTAWSLSNNGNGAKKVSVNVRYGDSDEWKTVWSVNNISNSFEQYFWSPSIDIDFDFDQVYFQVEQAHSTISTLAGCAVYQECDIDYVIMNYDSRDNLLQEQAYQYSINYYESQNLFLKKDGMTYGISNSIYRQEEEPKEPNENDIWYDISREPVKVYRYTNNEWKPFVDVLLGNINLFCNMIQTFHENPYNDNGTTKNMDCLWSSELANTVCASRADGDAMLIANYNCNVYHNLNIQDVTKYKTECYFKCVIDDCGYKIGDIVNIGLTPYLTKNTIGIFCPSTGWTIKHKKKDTDVNLTINRWRPVFKIREL